MTIETRSSWIYGYTITDSNRSLDFDEGGGELQASLNIGSYTLTEIAVEVARAMNAVGGQDYTVTVDRDLRAFTISAAGTFDLLAATGSRIGTGVWSTIGFAAVDLTSATSYTGGTSGDEFRPQFRLQDFQDFDQNQQAQDANVNRSTANIIETISFGNQEIMSCNITFQTDIAQGKNSYIENNATGRQDLIDFMVFAITKAKMEFIPDRDNNSTFTKVILERTPTNNRGVGFVVRELFNRNLAGYFETGRLQFRKVD